MVMRFRRIDVLQPDHECDLDFDVYRVSGKREESINSLPIADQVFFGVDAEQSREGFKIHYQSASGIRYFTTWLIHEESIETRMLGVSEDPFLVRFWKRCRSRFQPGVKL